MIVAKKSKLDAIHYSLLYKKALCHKMNGEEAQAETDYRAHSEFHRQEDSKNIILAMFGILILPALSDRR